MLIPLEVASFALDAGGNSPALVLREKAGARTLEFPIGPFEASAMALEWFTVAWEKPQTIQLCKTLIEQLGAAVDKIVLFRGVNAAVAARLCLVQNGLARTIECRPGDAVSLVLRCGRPIFAEESLLDPPAGTASSLESDTLRAAISATDTVEFGRYTLE